MNTRWRLLRQLQYAQIRLQLCDSITAITLWQIHTRTYEYVYVRVNATKSSGKRMWQADKQILELHFDGFGKDCNNYNNNYSKYLENFATKW